MNPDSSKPYSSCRAFTIVELLAIVVVLALLCSILTPTLARTKPNGRAIQCLDNTRRLILAWQMYADDNGGRLVPSYQGGNAQHGNFDPALGPGWAAGWLDWSLSTDNTNVQFLINPRWAGLAKYANLATNLFKCPSDKYLSDAQRARGWTQRVRSYSGNVGIGAGNAESGPWDPIYKHIRKTFEFQYPGPAETWLYLEEHPGSINDPVFFSPHQASWVDIPAAYHNGGTAVAFADGHSEIHRWTGSVTRVIQATGVFFPPPVSLGDADLHWMSYHAGRISIKSY